VTSPQVKRKVLDLKIGMIGLGRMGGSMSRRLIDGGHDVVAYDARPEAVDHFKGYGAAGASTLSELVDALHPPRAIWIMVPQGEITEATLRDLSGLLSRGDTVVDGGNSNYQETVRRAAEFAERGLHLLDVGVSGGVGGLKDGDSLMVGGDAAVFERLESIFRTLAPGPERGRLSRRHDT
jgi:6-phosphogluconate dehydrogenase